MHRIASVSTLFLIVVFAFAPRVSPQNRILPVRFSRPDLIRYDHDGFQINGKSIVIYSGSFHYFRCDSSEWHDRLVKIKAAGFNTVETYVAWNWHEREEGIADFSALDKFLTECESVRLYVIVRPGPYICAEWDVGGFPEWLAGKGVGFRSASADDIKWSRYYYDEVLPVIRRHLITNGGGVIMMQIENEYDYFDLPDSDKTVYLRSLYHDAIRDSIDVPIITCWTKQSRNNSDPDFSQVLDACNFYPAWDFSRTLDGIERAKQEEPNSPPMVTELQGGWFSSIDDKILRPVDEYGPDQIADLTRYVLAHGVKAVNYYMLYGGTNFGYWGSKGKTTSYDYTAPITEAGGLWEKYRSVKLIGDFVSMGGEYLARAHEVSGATSCESDSVESLLRSDGSVSFLYVWNKTNRVIETTVMVKAPQSLSFDLRLKLHPRESRFLPVNYPLPGGKSIKYTNVQISAVSEYRGKPLVVAYGYPGDDAEIYMDGSMNSEAVQSADRLYVWEGVYVLLISRDRASRLRIAGGKTGESFLASDSYLVVPDSESGKQVNVEFQTRPGIDSFSLLPESSVEKITVDGKPVKASSDSKFGLMSFEARTESVRQTKVPIEDIRAMADDEAESTFHDMGETDNEFPTLESTGRYQNGYSIYEGTLSLEEAKLIKFDYYDADWHSVAIDGKPVEGLTGNTESDFAGVELHGPSHKLLIVYENEGRPNGSFMEQHKGLKSISILEPDQIRILRDWKYSPAASPLPGPNPPEASIAFDDSKWKETAVGNGPQDFIGEHQGRWFRTHLNITPAEMTESPGVVFGGVDDNARVYVNGRLAVEHHGWDTKFQIPIGSLANAGDNVLAVYVQNEGGPGGIRQRVTFTCGTPVPAIVTLKFHGKLNGESAGWSAGNFDDSKWKPAGGWPIVSSPERVTWYRGTFVLPSRKGWVIPWRLHLFATGNMQIWLNGRLLGRYFAGGPQHDFYLPPGWMKQSDRNSLVLVLRPGGNSTSSIKDAYILPYEDFCVKKHSMEIIFK